jgi:hypothetical protein
MGLGQFFSTKAETHDNHSVPELRTRYYKTSTPKAVEAIEQIIKSDRSRFAFLDSSTDRGEINAEIKKPKKAFLIVNVVTIQPFRTAVDITCISKSGFLTDFGYSRKEVIALYKKIDQVLPFVGASLLEN